MKKRYLVAAAILVFTLSASACFDETASVAKTTTAPMAEASREQDSKEQAPKEQTDIDPEGENAFNTSEDVLTGIVDVNKGSITTVISDEGSESYVPGPDGKQSETYKDIKLGDTISTIYTNDLPNPDNIDTVVIDIEVE